MRRMQESITDLEVAGSGIYNIIFSNNNEAPKKLAEKIIQACSGNLHIKSEYCPSELTVLSRKLNDFCKEIEN